MRTILALLLIGSFCVVAILFFRSTNPAVSDQSQITELSIQLATVRAENAQLKADLAARPILEGQDKNTLHVSSRSGGIERLRLVRDLVLSNKVHLGIQLLGYDNRLTKDFVDLFDLSPNDRNVLDKAMQTARRELALSTIKRATVTRIAPGHYTIQVPAFIEEGGLIYNRVSDTLKNTLGHEKNLLFSELMGESFEHSFNRFGAEERTLTFSRTTAPDGSPSFLLDDRHVFGVGSSTSQSRARSIEEMKKIPGLAELMNLLPEQAGTE